MAARDYYLLNCVYSTDDHIAPRSFCVIELTTMVEVCVIVVSGTADGRQGHDEEDGEFAEHCSRRSTRDIKDCVCVVGLCSLNALILLLSRKRSDQRVRRRFWGKFNFAGRNERMQTLFAKGVSGKE